MEMFALHENPALPLPSSYDPASGRVRIDHLRKWKTAGERWVMLTSYDRYTAEVFDSAGVPVLLVGDSAANNVFGYETTIPVTVDELLPLVRAVTRVTRRSLVIGDLPFGSYEESTGMAVRTAIRFMKEGGCHAVKLEGGRQVAPQVNQIVQAGIPVMGHIGFTPQSQHQLSGYRVQGRTSQTADAILADARAVAEAGAFAIVMEMIPAALAREITSTLAIPTIGIGAGPFCDAQILIWQDMAGLNQGKPLRFVKKYADMAGALEEAALKFAADVYAGEFPGPEHSFD